MKYQNETCALTNQTPSKMLFRLILYSILISISLAISLPDPIISETRARIYSYKNHPTPTKFLDYKLNGTYHGYKIDYNGEINDELMFSFVFNQKTNNLWTNAWEDGGESGTYKHDNKHNGRIWLQFDDSITTTSSVACTSIITTASSRYLWLSCWYGGDTDAEPEFLHSSNVNDLFLVPPHVRPFILWQSESNTWVPDLTVSMVDVSRTSLFNKSPTKLREIEVTATATNANFVSDSNCNLIDIVIITNGAGDNNSLEENSISMKIKTCHSQDSRSFAIDIGMQLNSKKTLHLLNIGKHPPLHLYDAYTGEEIEEIKEIKENNNNNDNNLNERNVIMVVFADEPFIWPGIEKGFSRPFNINMRPPTPTGWERAIPSSLIKLNLITVSLQPRLFHLEGLMGNKTASMFKQTLLNGRKNENLLKVDDSLYSPSRVSSGSLFVSYEIKEYFSDFFNLILSVAKAMHLPTTQVLQLVHYNQFGKFSHHYDAPFEFIDTEERGRLLTLFMYMNNANGSTNFPFANLNNKIDTRFNIKNLQTCQYGVNITSKKLHSTLWYNLRPSDLQVDPWSYHGACQVQNIEGKFGANLWFQLLPEVFLKK